MGIFVQEKLKKIFKMANGGYLVFPIRMILATFDLQATSMILTKFQVNCLSVQQKKRKIDFQDDQNGSHLGFLIRMILAILIYQSPLCSLTSFVSTGFSVGSREEAKNRFFFWSTSHPKASYLGSSQLAFGFRRRSEKQIFKMAVIAAILDFRSEQFYFFFIYKSLWCFLPSFKSIRLSVQDQEHKIDFWRWPPPWKFDWNDVSYFWSTSHSDASYEVSSQLAFLFRRRSEK